MTIQTQELINIERFSPVDLKIPIKKALNFYEFMIFYEDLRFVKDREKAIKDFLMCHSFFSNIKNYLFGLIKPEENKWLNEFHDEYNALVEALARIEDIIVQDFVGPGEARIRTRESFFEPMRLFNYLNEAFNSVVYYPLIEAFKKYRRIKDFIKIKKLDKEGEELSEENLRNLTSSEHENLFTYFLFFEIYRGAINVGNMIRDPKKPQTLVDKSTHKFYGQNPPGTYLPEHESHEGQEIIESFVDQFGGVDDSGN